MTWRTKRRCVGCKRWRIGRRSAWSGRSSRPPACPPGSTSGWRGGTREAQWSVTALSLIYCYLMWPQTLQFFYLHYSSSLKRDVSFKSVCCVVVMVCIPCISCVSYSGREAHSPAARQQWNWTAGARGRQRQRKFLFLSEQRPSQPLPWTFLILHLFYFLIYQDGWETRVPRRSQEAGIPSSCKAHFCALSHKTITIISDTSWLL